MSNRGETAANGADLSINPAIPDSRRPMPARHQELRWMHRIRAILAVLTDPLLIFR
jgi:hypothetical protein